MAEKRRGPPDSRCVKTANGDNGRIVALNFIIRRRTSSMTRANRPACLDEKRPEKTPILRLVPEARRRHDGRIREKKLQCAREAVDAIPSLPSERTVVGNVPTASRHLWSMENCAHYVLGMADAARSPGS